VRDHPVEIAASVLLSLLAIGVLVHFVPWLLGVLGFSLEAPVEGECLIST